MQIEDIVDKRPTVYLPSDEDTQVVIKVDGADPIEMSIIDLDIMVDRASTKARENSTEWRAELKDLIRLELNLKLTVNQVYWLYVANRERIEAVKKKLFGG